ncbi:MAG: hypothetical protein JJE17_00290 [Peptostreptococcaceae bacterium]|nr:hypothetical protein [Peptostreptococcaceae bacterium]
MKKILSILCLLVIIVSCIKQKYYEIPTDANGNVILTGVSSTTTTGISTLDDNFSVTATFATAKVGDVMKVELLQLQIPPEGGSVKQLLPMAGTQKDVTVGSDMKATVSYTRAEAMLTKATDYVTVTFGGETDDAKARVDMVSATIVSKPNVFGNEVEVARTAETAYFNVTVEPKEGSYTGDLVAKMKNGKNELWETITGSPFSGSQPFLIPISGTDFAIDKDTVYFSFTSSKGSYSDNIISTIIVRDPYFFLKKTATINVTQAIDLLINGARADTVGDVVVTDTALIITASSASGSLRIQGGASWLAASVNNSIEFVPSTLAMYTANNATLAIATYNTAEGLGDTMSEADPIAGEGVYIFKAFNGTGQEDVYYGMLKFSNTTASSVALEYRIGNMYAHLLVIR